MTYYLLVIYHLFPANTYSCDLLQSIHIIPSMSSPGFDWIHVKAKTLRERVSQSNKGEQERVSTSAWSLSYYSRFLVDSLPFCICNGCGIPITSQARLFPVGLSNYPCMYWQLMKPELTPPTNRVTRTTREWHIPSLNYQVSFLFRRVIIPRSHFAALSIRELKSDTPIVN